MPRLITVLLLLAISASVVSCADDDGGSAETTPTQPTTETSPTAGSTALPGGAQFEDVVLASEVDPATREPITRVRAFRSSDPAMHAAIRAKNVPAGGQVIFRWTKGASVAGTITVDVAEAIDESWIGASIRPNGPIPTGDDWLLAVTYNGVSVGSVTFSVQ